MNFSEKTTEIWGHAPGEKQGINIVEIIFKDGLLLHKKGDIGGTCMILNPNLEKSLQFIDNNDLHMNRRKCIIVKIPIGYKVLVGSEQSIIYRPFCDEVFLDSKLKLKILPEFIYGAYNKDTKQLTKNPLFYENLSASEQKKCDLKLKQEYCDTLNNFRGGVKHYYYDILCDPESELDDWIKVFPLTSEEVEKYDNPVNNASEPIDGKRKVENKQISFEDPKEFVPDENWM